MKNKFIASTMILILGGFITKILGFVIKIVYTRIITNDGVNLYSLMIPTYSLLITIATLAMPMAISKLVSEGKKRSLSILMSSVFIMIFINFFLVSIMFFLSKPLAVHLLHNEQVYYLLLAATLTLPFISISSIVKGYFFGKQRMFPYAFRTSDSSFFNRGVFTFFCQEKHTYRGRFFCSFKYRFGVFFSFYFLFFPS